ncbi:isochorismatase family protein [Aureimonas sp. ME7]|uniref:cysteine hydrolase family protein n=1 Tax=Aureimonas sp. ME7 TaxID=2744252 RepID=UPI0015F79CCE|nr:isochorismatase family protein [Aureimonas sp. ME7]
MNGRIDQPLAGTRRALVVVDAQPATLKAPAAWEVLERIRAYVRAAPYDAYLVAIYHAPPDSMFARQGGWILNADAAGPSDADILAAIEASGRPKLSIEKTIRSVLKTEDARTFLRAHRIDELHFVGFDINDCVLASAYDAIDSGFHAFVLEELAFRTDADAGLIEATLTLLRHQGMTNRTRRFAANPVALRDPSSPQEGSDRMAGARDLVKATGPRA